MNATPATRAVPDLFQRDPTSMRASTDAAVAQTATTIRVSSNASSPVTRWRSGRRSVEVSPRSTRTAGGEELGDEAEGGQFGECDYVLVLLVLLGSPAASGAGLGTLLAVVTGRSPVLVEVPADRNTTRPRLA